MKSIDEDLVEDNISNDKGGGNDDDDDDDAFGSKGLNFLRVQEIRFHIYSYFATFFCSVF
jgi:hypothetical protein